MAKKKKKKSRVSAGLVVLLILILIAMALLVYIIKLVRDNSKQTTSDTAENETNISTIETTADSNIKVTLKENSITVAANQEINAYDVVDSVTCEGEYSVAFVENIESENPIGDMTETLSFTDEGIYIVDVIAVDSTETYALTPLTINVSESDYSEYLNSGAEVTIAEDSDFTEFSTEEVPYGYGEEYDDNNRPTGCTWYDNLYGKYAVDFIQPESDYVFLTFDEDEEGGYTEQILDTLKEKNVKAVFFVTLSYVKDNPDLVQRMIDEGHIIGNHTATHPEEGMTSLSVSEQMNEISELNDYLKDNFSYNCYLFRFPGEAFSEQSLAVVQSLGMRSVFWSFTYRDWDTDNQPDVQTSLATAVERAHGGAIYLLHAVSKTNADMLGDLIDQIEEKGYEFGYYAKVD